MIEDELQSTKIRLANGSNFQRILLNVFVEVETTASLRKDIAQNNVETGKDTVLLEELKSSLVKEQNARTEFEKDLNQLR